MKANQFGFCSKHSKEHALISLIKTIKKCLDYDDIVCGVFVVCVDCNVNHEILLEKLIQHRIGNKKNNWLQSLNQ